MKGTNEIMDIVILHELENLPRKSLFDYGCGDTDLTKKISEMDFGVVGYDISEKAISIQKKKNCNEKISFLVGPEYNNVKKDLKGCFDVVVSSLVLCVIKDPLEVEEVISDIASLLNNSGYAFIGICNPLYFDIIETEIQTKSIPRNVSYGDQFEINKTIKLIGSTRVDYHRPLEFYENLLKKHNFKVKKIIQTNGKDHLGNFASDFLIFKLQKED